MHPIKLAVASVALVAGSHVAIAAQSLNVSKTLTVNKSAEEVWKAIGGFCSIADWHPAIAKCELVKKGDTTFRTLTLGDGAKIEQKQSASSPMSYKYEIIESPLPLKDYKGTIGVKGDSKSATVSWEGSFLANGKPDAEVEKLVTGMYEAGLKSIKEKFSK